MCERVTQSEVTDSGTLSITEVARQLGVKPATIYAWIYREKIPAFKLRGHWKFNRASVQSFYGNGKTKKLP